MEFNFTCIRDITFGVPRTARDSEFSIELYVNIYTVFDRALLPHIGDLPNGLHTDLKFQNQAIQCCLFESHETKYGKAAWRVGAVPVYAIPRC